ncbi:MAG: DUF1512 domain-containing protein [Thaumarchaeota archaeon]|nr:MAG: DUF1512 domain-containing protein [Nitrososphaerota archaeon]
MDAQADHGSGEEVSPSSPPTPRGHKHHIERKEEEGDELAVSSIPFALLPGIDLNSLFSLATYALFFVFILYGQRIQYYVTLGSISRSLNRLKVMEDGAKKEALDYITQGRGDKEEIAERVNGVLEYVTIMPESVDPSGIISKIDHVVRTGDDRIRSEVRALLGSADRVKVSVASQGREALLSYREEDELIHDSRSAADDDAADNGASAGTRKCRDGDKGSAANRRRARADGCFEVPHRRHSSSDSWERHRDGRDPVRGESALRGEGGGSHGLCRRTRSGPETADRGDGCQTGRNHNGGCRAEA